MFLIILLWNISNKFKNKQNSIRKPYIAITYLKQLSAHSKSCFICTPKYFPTTNSLTNQIPEVLLLHSQICQCVFLLDKDSLFKK